MNSEWYRLANVVLGYGAFAGFLLWMALHWSAIRSRGNPLFAAIGWVLPLGGLTLLFTVATGSAVAYVRHLPPNPISPGVTVALSLVCAGLLLLLRKR